MECKGYFWLEQDEALVDAKCVSGMVWWIQWQECCDKKSNFIKFKHPFGTFDFLSHTIFVQWVQIGKGTQNLTELFAKFLFLNLKL